MKKLCFVLVVTICANSVAFAKCDFSKGIEKTPDSRYSYSKECHKAVGAAVQNLEYREEQVVELKTQIDLKELVANKEKERAELWLKTSDQLEKQVNDYRARDNTTKIIYFVLGVLATSAAVYGAKQLGN